jgi:hypothetical protein
VKQGLKCLNKVFTMLLPCFRGFETCLFNYFFIFQGYVLDDFLNQYNKVVDVIVPMLHPMFEGNLKLTFKLFRNTQVLWEEHYNRIT